ALFSGTPAQLDCLLKKAAAITRPVPSQREFEEIRNAYAALDWKKMEQPRYDARLYRGALGPLYPSSAEVRSVSRDEVELYRRATLEPSRSVLVIVGDLDPDSAVERAAAAFAAWPRDDAPSLPLPQPLSLLQ